MPDILLLILYFIIAIVIGGFTFFGILWGAMYTRIPTKKLEKVIKLSNLGFGKTAVDMGAGLGTFSFEAAYTGAHIVAVEIDPFKVAVMKFLLRYNNNMAKAMMRNPLPTGKYAVSHLNVDIIRGNMLNADLTKADIVFCNLSPVLMPKVAAKAKQEMKPGAELISVEWKVPNWKPMFSDEADKIYVYNVGRQNELPDKL